MNCGHSRIRQRCGKSTGDEPFMCPTNQSENDGCVEQDSWQQTIVTLAKGQPSSIVVLSKDLQIWGTNRLCCRG